MITTAAGRLQDLSHSSLDPGVTLWLVYALASVVISGVLLVLSYGVVGQRLLPAARLAQVAPGKLESEVVRLWGGEILREEAELDLTVKEKEQILKSTRLADSSIQRSAKWLPPICALVVILIGWIMFALGVVWGVHGNVIAGTVGE